MYIPRASIHKWTLIATASARKFRLPHKPQPSNSQDFTHYPYIRYPTESIAVDACLDSKIILSNAPTSSVFNRTSLQDACKKEKAIEPVLFSTDPSVPLYSSCSIIILYHPPHCPFHSSLRLAAHPMVISINFNPTQPTTVY
jgi:hypothetical protein